MIAAPSFLDPDNLDLSRFIAPPSSRILTTHPQFLFNEGTRYRLVGMEEVANTPVNRSEQAGWLNVISGLWAKTVYRPVYMPFRTPLCPELYSTFFSLRGRVKEDERSAPLIGTTYDLANDVDRNQPGALYLYGTLLPEASASTYRLKMQLHSDGNRYAYISYETGRAAEANNNPALAISSYQMAAEQNHAEACYRLGYLIAKGSSVERDDKKAFAFFKKGADLGHPHAQYRVACMYRDGLGVSKNNKQAVLYYGMAAEEGHKEAMFQFWKYYHPKPEDVPADKQLSDAYLKTAAEGGHMESQFHYAQTFLPSFREGAAVWLKKAADQGHQEAMYLFGELHTHLLDTLPLEDGLPYLLRAAKKGHNNAKRLLRLLIVSSNDGMYRFRRNSSLQFGKENYLEVRTKSNSVQNSRSDERDVQKTERETTRNDETGQNRRPSVQIATSESKDDNNN